MPSGAKSTYQIRERPAETSGYDASGAVPEPEPGQRIRSDQLPCHDHYQFARPVSSPKLLTPHAAIGVKDAAESTSASDPDPPKAKPFHFISFHFGCINPFAFAFALMRRLTHRELPKIITNEPANDSDADSLSSRGPLKGIRRRVRARRPHPIT